jgi:excisionase family DNA binding protein
MAAELMTTREVADYLRLGERKVYDLLAKRAIPCLRLEGKWLFPKPLIDAWLLEHREGPGVQPRAEPPLIVAGSHDPLLDWALRESGSGLAVVYEGSLAGLDRLAAGAALAAGVHVIDPTSGEFNIPLVAARLGGEPLVLLQFATREQGLLVPPGNPTGIRTVADLDGLRFATRQPEAGSHLLLAHLAREAGLDLDQIRGLPAVRSETEVAQAVASGAADAGLAIRAAAAARGLDFVPLTTERFDILVWRRAFFDEPFQRLVAFGRSEAFAERARQLGGYDVAGIWSVRFNGA